MASLAELLAEDGFTRKARSRKTKAAAPRAVSMPLYSDTNTNKNATFLKFRSQELHGRSLSNTGSSLSKEGAACENFFPRGSQGEWDFDPHRGRKHESQSYKDDKLKNKVFNLDVHAPSEEDMQISVCDAAIRALVSISVSHIGDFFTDESFRALLRRVCNACLKDEDRGGEGGAFAELEKAITIVEKAVERRSTKELQKASSKLNIMTGLSSIALKNGSNFGAPNSCLAACAHLYLSVIFKIYKEDRMAANHLLQVFCFAPFEARAILLPALWEELFLPNLAHISEWYDQEMDSISRVPSRAKNMDILLKMYDSALNKETQKFAIYYREWIVDETKAPFPPSIDLPSADFHRISRENSRANGREEACSMRKSFSCKSTMVSRQLYESHSSQEIEKGAAKDMKIGKHVKEEEWEKATNLDMCLRSIKNLLDEDTDQLKNEHEGEEANGSKRTFFDMVDESSSVIENECTLNKIAEAIFQLNDVDLQLQNKSIATVSVCKDYLKNNVPLSELRRIDSEPKKCDLAIGLSAELCYTSKDINQGSIFANSVTKKTIDISVSETFGHVLFLTAQTAKIEMKRNYKSEDALALDIVDRLLTGHSKEEQMENARNLIAIGGLQFLVEQFEKGNSHEKTRVVRSLLCCIKAKGDCRKYLAVNLQASCILEQLHSKLVDARANAVKLLSELICLNRRRDVISFLSGLLRERTAETMDALLVYLHSTAPEEKAIVAVLLLHFDLMLGGSKKSVYKEEAMEAITLALNCCLFDKKVIPNTQRALLMLGGHFSTFGEILTESWLLEKGGFLDGNNNTSSYYDDEVDEILSIDEAKLEWKWLKEASLAILSDGNASFLKALSKCLDSGNQDLVRTSLVTVAWMSYAFESTTSVANRVRLTALSAFIPQLNEQLEHNEETESRMLASITLQNFIKAKARKSVHLG
ncbi:uncharacterized protein LOC141811582 [Curcuma longa]|uniref:uncharacterized protein LOC141811582 n=1 Tax=Curcuma longa TaxID=136217 RepID=UPI003D9EE876